MILKVFAIFDTKANYYKNPFMFHSIGEATRGFTDLANDAQTEIGKHPEDFCLFYIAEFDMDKGQYINQTPPQSCGLAIEYKKENKIQEVR